MGKAIVLAGAALLCAGGADAASWSSLFQSPSGSPAPAAQQAIQQGLGGLQEAWSGFQSLPRQEQDRLRKQLLGTVASQLNLNPQDLDILNPDNPFFGDGMTLTVDRRTGTAYLLGANGASASFSAKDNIFTGVIRGRDNVPRTVVVVREKDGYAAYLDTQRLDAVGTVNASDGTLSVVAAGPNGRPLTIRRESDGSFTVNGRPPDATLVTGSTPPG